NVVNGIEIVYDIKNDSPRTIKHGQKSGTPKNYLLSADEYFVGFFGAVDDNPDAPVLRRLGFLIYNNQNGALSNFGISIHLIWRESWTDNHLGAYPDGNQNGVKGFTSLGLIAGFSGTESTNGNPLIDPRSLDTLAIYKFMSSGDSNTGISGGI
ncbi:hypothetical protein H0H93_011341, partial [Arthromyces matolae]